MCGSCLLGWSPDMLSVNKTNTLRADLAKKEISSSGWRRSSRNYENYASFSFCILCACIVIVGWGHKSLLDYAPVTHCTIFWCNFRFFKQSDRRQTSWKSIFYSPSSFNYTVPANCFIWKLILTRQIKLQNGAVYICPFCLIVFLLGVNIIVLVWVLEGFLPLVVFWGFFGCGLAFLPALSHWSLQLWSEGLQMTNTEI